LSEGSTHTSPASISDGYRSEPYDRETGQLCSNNGHIHALV
jgi:hypothetical protein